VNRRFKRGKILLLSVVLSATCAYGKSTTSSQRSPAPQKADSKVLRAKEPKPLAKTVSKTHAYHSAKVFTLLDAFEQALNTNPALLETIANREAALHNLSEVRGGYYPTVAASYSLGHNHSVVPNANYIDSFFQTRSITATQLLFDGGVQSGLVGVADAQFEESEGLTREEVNSLAEDTASAYLTYLRDKQLLALSRQI